MWKQKQTSIYYQNLKNKVLFIKKKDLSVFKKKRNLKSGKGRICIHKSTKSKIHEMVVFHKKNAYVRPHKHLNKAESFQVIKGDVTLIIFNNYGKPIKKVDMGEYASGKIFYYKMQKSYFHTQIINRDTVFKEVTNGPFIKKKTLEAKWSPKDSDQKKVKDYLLFLKKYKIK